MGARRGRVGATREGTFGVFLATLWGILGWRVAGAAVLTLVSSVTEGVGLLMLVPLLDLTGVETGSGALGRIGDLLASGFRVVGLAPSLPLVLTLFTLVMALRFWLSRWQTIYNAALVQRVVATLRQRLFAAISEARWVFLVQRRGSDLSHVLIDEIARVGALMRALLSLLVGLVVTFVYVAMAFVVSLPMTLLALASGALLTAILRGAVRQSRTRGRDITDKYQTLFGAVGDHLSGMKTSKSHGVEERHVAFFGRVVDEVRSAHVALIANHADVRFWFNLGTVAILGVVLYVAVDVLTVPAAELLLLLLIFSRLMPRLSNLQGSWQQIGNDLPAFENLARAQARCEAAGEGGRGRAPAPRLRRGIRLEEVGFRYLDDGPDVLRGVTLELPAGTTTAVVGASGSGKSTLADVAAGLIAPRSGRVLVDGAPLDDGARRAWRERIGYVAQDTFLFHDSVRANLRLTRPDADEAEIDAALSAAEAAEFVAALPDGLDTVVGDRGATLSGGERQRLALARALLRRPALLVLDEATSALDTENEMRVQHAIDALSGRTTILVIAHRLATVRNADAIHVVERGEIVESGSWSDLVADEESRFHALCRAQGVLLPDLAARS